MDRFSIPTKMNAVPVGDDACAPPSKELGLDDLTNAECAAALVIAPNGKLRQVRPGHLYSYEAPAGHCHWPKATDDGLERDRENVYRQIQAAIDAEAISSR